MMLHMRRPFQRNLTVKMSWLSSLALNGRVFRGKTPYRPAEKISGRAIKGQIEDQRDRALKD